MSTTTSGTPDRPNSILLGHRQQRGWGRLKLAKVFEQVARQHDLPLSATTESVKKQIQRVESGTISVPEPMYQRLWSLAFEVDEVELFGHLEPQRCDETPRFTVISDKFIPAYLGPSHAARLSTSMSTPDDSWMTCSRERYSHPNGSCDIYIFPFGVGVFHVQEKLEFTDISSLAVWRRQTQKDARLWATSEFQGLTSEPKVSAPYVLSTYWVEDPIWSGAELETALKLVSMPSVLLDRDPEAIGPDNRESLLGGALLIERSLIREGFAHPDLVSFGTKGISTAFASWSGVSYFPVASKRALTRSDLVACETISQAVWCYCHHILRQVEDGSDPDIPRDFGWKFLRGARARLSAERPRETTQLRALRMAIIETSGLTRQLGAALDVLRETEIGA